MLPEERLAYCTQAELDAMALIAAGATYSQAAQLLGITRNAVKRRMRRARDRQAARRKPLVRVPKPRLMKH